MPLASTSAAALGYIPEATFGVTPATGNYRRLRMTGESLDFSIEKTASAEINSTRTTSSMSPVSASATGGIQGELQYAEYDLLMAGTLQSTWAAYGTNGVGATFIQIQLDLVFVNDFDGHAGVPFETSRNTSASPYSMSRTIPDGW